MATKYETAASIPVLRRVEDGDDVDAGGVMRLDSDVWQAMDHDFPRAGNLTGPTGLRKAFQAFNRTKHAFGYRARRIGVSFLDIVSDVGEVADRRQLPPNPNTVLLFEESANVRVCRVGGWFLKAAVDLGDLFGAELDARRILLGQAQQKIDRSFLAVFREGSDFGNRLFKSFGHRRIIAGKAPAGGNR